MIRFSSRLILPSLLLLAGAIGMPAATISLDDVGTDPIITSPYFTFTTDTFGDFTGQFTNLSNPAMDFTFLQLTATFSPAFWASAQGPVNTGVFCDGGNAFTTCSYQLETFDFTLKVFFSGLDATHHGIPLNDILGVVASQFEPSQTIAAQAVPSPTPEPSSLVLMGTALLILVVGGKKFLKARVRE